MGKIDILKRGFAHALYNVKEYAPEISLVVGGVSIVTGTVLACKRTLKVDGILEEHNAKIKKIKDVYEHPENYDLDELDSEYTEDDYKRDLFTVHTQTALEFCKNFMIPAVLVVGGYACCVTGNVLLRRRLVEAVAAAKAIDISYRNYRKNVIDKYGKEVDDEMRYGITTNVVSEKVVDPETGKKKTVKTEEKLIDSEGFCDPYSAFFDASNVNFTKDYQMNLAYLGSIEDTANRKLKTQGHVFLNDVFDLLKMPRTYVGHYAGWTTNGDGDGKISFGLEQYKDRITGEPVFLLKFNVDGYIIDKVWDKCKDRPDFEVTTV